VTYGTGWTASQIDPTIRKFSEMIDEFAYVSSDLNDLKQNGVYSTPTISLVQSPTIKYKDYYKGVSPSPLLDTSISIKYHNKTTQLGYTT